MKMLIQLNTGRLVLRKAVFTLPVSKPSVFCSIKIDVVCCRPSNGKRLMFGTSDEGRTLETSAQRLTKTCRVKFC